jgi:hypothetical protein
MIVNAVEAEKPNARYEAPLSARIFLLFRWLFSDRAFEWIRRTDFRLPWRIGESAVILSHSYRRGYEQNQRQISVMRKK